MRTATRSCSSCDTPLPADVAFCPNCGTATPTDLNVAFGEGFEDRLKAALADRYRVDRELGQGGMAVVFLARDLKHDRDVALKVMRPELAASIGTDRFLREIQIAAKLSHPHILGVYDSGEAEGFLYYVMPYVEGESLRDRLNRQKQLPMDDALRITRDVAAALSHAHAHEIVHRDIKPENILLHDGEAVVTDFGIARAASDAGERLTVTGIAVGTPAYMSPEQSVGDSNLDGRSDLYSLGCVLYEMLAGETPYLGNTPQAIIAKKLSEPAPRVSVVRDAVPAPIDDALTIAMARTRADRFATAEGFALALKVDWEAHRRETASSATHMRRAELTEREFQLTAELCRQLDRAELDPMMVGDHLSYLDNQVRSDVLVCHLHGFGGDHSTFSDILEESPYRSVAVSLYGFEPSAVKRRSISMSDHVTVVRHFLTWMAGAVEPTVTVLVGFSSGADLGLRLIADWPGDQPPVVDGLLALGCNLNLDTCFVSSALASLSSEHGTEMLPHLRASGAQAANLGEWLNVHEYLVNILRKFQHDLRLLQRHGEEVVRPFQDGGNPFPDWYKAACSRVKALRCVFADTEMETRPVRQLILAHLEEGVLGECYNEKSIMIEPDADHFDLLDPQRIKRHLAEMLATIP
jgi:serine/threonine protein kinase